MLSRFRQKNYFPYLRLARKGCPLSYIRYIRNTHVPCLRVIHMVAQALYKVVKVQCKRFVFRLNLLAYYSTLVSVCQPFNKTFLNFFKGFQIT